MVPLLKKKIPAMSLGILFLMFFLFYSKFEVDFQYFTLEKIFVPIDLIVSEIVSLIKFDSGKGIFTKSYLERLCKCLTQNK